MEFKELIISSSNKESCFGKEKLIFFIIYGAIILLIVFLFQEHQIGLLLLIGAFFLVYAIVGKGILKPREWIKISADFIVLKIQHDRPIAIPVKNIKYIRLNNGKIEFGFAYYNDSYNIRWIKDDELTKLKTAIEKLSRLCHFEFLTTEFSGENTVPGSWAGSHSQTQ